MYKVIRYEYNQDSWSRGDYYQKTIGYFNSLELAQQAMNYEEKIEQYEEPENFFTYDSGYKNVFYSILEKDTKVFTSIEEYYNSK